MKPLITLLCFVVFAYSNLSGQIRVYTDSSVGVGTESSNPTSFDGVVPDPNDRTENSKVLITDSEKLTGLKINRAFTASSPAGTKYGIYNNISPYGTNFTYGIYNVISGSTGGRYGIYNRLNNNSSTSWSYMIGMYNNNTNSSSGTLYGISNSIRRYGTGAGNGIYNYFYQIGSNSGYRSGGIYNRVYIYGGGNLGHGIYNEVRTNTSTTGSKYGIYNDLISSGTGTRYALYSKITGAGYAGYFEGDVAHNGTTIWTSDRQLKDDIRPVENALALVESLNPTNYLVRNNPDNEFRGERSYGFIAQELEVVLPNLVHELEQPGKSVAITRIVEGDEFIIEEDEEGNPTERTVQEGEEITEYITGEPIKLKGVSYIEFIPILTKAIQEQQELITQQADKLTKQQDAIEKLQAAVAALEAGN